MNKDYIEINKEAYEILAKEYNERNYEVGKEFWYEIYDKIKLKQGNKRILEIGPGHGRNIEIFKKYSNTLDITAIELSENMCEIIKKNNPDIKLINGNIMEYDFKDEKYDVIQMIAVIHLFPKEDAYKVLEKIRSLLKDDGYLIIGTTMNNEDKEGYYEKEDYNQKVKRFRHKYTKESYESLLKQSGFEIYKPYFIKENDRNKLWYDAVVKINK